MDQLPIQHADALVVLADRPKDGWHAVSGLVLADMIGEGLLSYDGPCIYRLTARGVERLPTARLAVATFKLPERHRERIREELGRAPADAKLRYYVALTLLEKLEASTPPYIRESYEQVVEILRRAAELPAVVTRADGAP